MSDPYIKVRTQEIEELETQAAEYFDNFKTFGLLAIVFYFTGLVLVFMERELASYISLASGVVLWILANRYMKKHNKVMLEMGNIQHDIFKHTMDNLMVTIKEKAHEESKRKLADKARTISVVRGRRGGGTNRTGSNGSDVKSGSTDSK